VGTSDDNKEIATTKSGHTAPGPGPAANLGPPPAPTGPVPQPYLYIAQSKSAQKTTTTKYIPVAEALKEDSTMDVERPANQPAQPGGVQGDIVSHAIVGTATCITGSRNFKSSKGICATGDSVMLNVPMPGGKGAQSKGTLILGADLVNGTAPGDKLATVITAGEPVAVVSGAVVDEMTDFVLLGTIVLEIKRIYCSAWNREKTLFGRGGFTSSLNQWIELENDKTVFTNDAGSKIPFAIVAPDGVATHRGRRLTLRRARSGIYEITDGNTWRTLEFAPLEASDGRAVLRTIRDAWGNRVELRYENGRLATVIDTAKRELRCKYDDAGRVARIELWALEELRQWVDYAYHPEGELASATDALGHAERYLYDGSHRLIEKTRKNGVRFYYDYDRETGDALRTWGDGGIHPVNFVYDRKRNETVTTATPAPRVYHWNAAGAVEIEQTLDGATVNQTTYDDDLLVLSEKNAGGEERTYEYDDRGYLVAEVDPAGNVRRWELDPEFRRPVRRIEPDGTKIEYTLGARGELLGVTFPDGNAYSYVCDRYGRLTGLYGPDGTIFERAYDEAHNLVRVVTGEGATLLMEHDPLGRVTKVSDSAGSVEKTGYDALGRVVERTLPDGTHLLISVDALGNVTRSDDGSGPAVVMEYTGTGTLCRRTMPDGQVWEFEHDAMERLRAIKNPKGETYELRLDRAGRITEEKTFDGRYIRYQHTRAGRLARIDYDDDSWRAFQYDPAGHIVEESSPHGSRIFERDELGRVVKAIVEEHDGSVVVEFERDALGRVIRETQGQQTIKYEYDARGRRATRVLPGGQTTRYHYTLLGLLSGIDHDGYKVLFQRDPMGREVRRHLYDPGVDIFTKSSTTGLLLEQAVVAVRPSGPETIGRRAWRYGPHARLAGANDARFGSMVYEHDVMGQLRSTSIAGTSEEFAYDMAGVLVGAARDGAALGEPWSTATGNVLRRAGDATFSNDPRRRRREHIDAEGKSTRYLWDCRDQLREVVLPSGERVLYWYDAFGRRVRRAVVPPDPPIAELRAADPPRVTTFLWEDDVIVAEADGTGWERVYVYERGLPLPVLHAEGGEVLAYVNDQVGRPYELIDGRGRVAWAAAFGAWGQLMREVRDEATPRARPATTPLRQPGHYADTETGLLCTRHRYFDPGTARWLSPDPIGIQGGPDHFGFAGSPVTRVDVYGLCTIDWLRKVDAAIEAHSRSVELMNQLPEKSRGFSVYSAAVIEQDGKTRIVIGTNNPDGYLHPNITLNPGEQMVFAGPNSHAERNITQWIAAQNAANPDGPQITLLAAGATIPHCGNCTCAVSGAGGVTASGIRVRGNNAWGVDPVTGNGVVLNNTE
jgi:RHS repeat-associated protein